MRSGLTEVCD